MLTEEWNVYHSSGGCEQEIFDRCPFLLSRLGLSPGLPSTQRRIVRFFGHVLREWADTTIILFWPIFDIFVLQADVYSCVCVSRSSSNSCLRATVPYLHMQNRIDFVTHIRLTCKCNARFNLNSHASDTNTNIVGRVSLEMALGLLTNTLPQMSQPIRNLIHWNCFVQISIKQLSLLFFFQECHDIFERMVQNK